MQSPDNFRAEKAERIAEVTQASAISVIRLLTKLHKYTRKKSRIVSKRTNYKNRRLYRYRHALILAEIAILKYMTGVQLQLILSQPIPKYSHGSAGNIEQAIVGENGKEETIINNADNTAGQ